MQENGIMQQNELITFDSLIRTLLEVYLFINTNIVPFPLKVIEIDNQRSMTDELYSIKIEKQGKKEKLIEISIKYKTEIKLLQSTETNLDSMLTGTQKSSPLIQENLGVYIQETNHEINRIIERYRTEGELTRLSQDVDSKFVNIQKALKIPITSYFDVRNISNNIAASITDLLGSDRHISIAYYASTEQVRKFSEGIFSTLKNILHHVPENKFDELRTKESSIYNKLQDLILNSKFITKKSVEKIEPLKISDDASRTIALELIRLYGNYNQIREVSK